MAISGQYHLNVDRSNDSAEYRIPFYCDALRIIVGAHAMLRCAGDDHSDSDEPAITGEIVRCAREFVEGPEAPGWAYRYAVHDDPPENDATRRGKHRRRVDVIVKCLRQGRHPRMRFEAKRLKRPDFLVAAYVGGTGLGEFIAGSYAVVDDAAGILGYIQSDDCDYWVKEISETIEKKKREVELIEGDQWQEACVDGVNQCYRTRHNRSAFKRELLVYHLLLVFCKGK